MAHLVTALVTVCKNAELIEASLSKRYTSEVRYTVYMPQVSYTSYSTYKIRLGITSSQLKVQLVTVQLESFAT